MLRSLNVYHQISMNYTLIVSQYKYFSSLKYMSLLHLCVCVCTHVLVPTLSAMTHGQRTTLEVMCLGASNSDHQGWQHAPLPTESSCQPYFVLSFFQVFLFQPHSWLLYGEPLLFQSYLLWT